MSPSTSLAVILFAISFSFSNAIPAISPSAAAPLVGATAPYNAVDVSPVLISFSLEGDAWPDWVAQAPSYNQRNEFFHNSLKNLQARTGSWPDIRAGANSEDRTNFDEKIQIIQETQVPPTSSLPYPEAQNITVGPGYYSLSKFLPRGTSMTWGFNFGSANLTLATIELNAILDAFKRNTWEGGVKGSGVELKLVELGNEADLYGHNGHRQTGYDEEDYTAEWRNYTLSLLNSTALSSNDPSTPQIQALSFGHSDYGKGNSFSPEGAFQDGLLNGTLRQYIGAISQHHYSGGCCTALIQDLMNKTAIRANLTQFQPDIAAVQQAGLPYYFGETNTYFNHGVPKVSDAGGAALWLADYTLFGATIGIEKMYFHEGIGYKYNLIQPVPLNRSIEDGTPLPSPLPPHVQAPYYGALAVTEFLGSSWDRQVVEIDFSDDDNLSGFALYTEGGNKLSKVLLFNHEPYLSSALNATSDSTSTFGSGERPSASVSLVAVGRPSFLRRLFGGGVSIKRLNIPFADVPTGLTWAGQSFDDGVPVGNVVVERQSAYFPVVIAATEVVLVEY